MSESDRDLWGTPDGGVLRTHGVTQCAGRPCVLHAPSEHRMRDWPVKFRADRGWLAERTCRHGVGHPDPDDVAWRASRGSEGWDVHGCDGCCAPPARGESEGETR